MAQLRWFIDWADKHNGLMTFLATLAIAILTFFLVTTSNRQWQTMRDQLKVMEAPNVTPGRQDGTMGELLTPSRGQKTGVLLYFHNGGQGPALNFNVQLFNVKGPTTEQHMARFGGDSGRVVMQIGGGIAIPAGSDRKAIFNDWIPDSMVDAAKNGTAPLVLSGLFEYCDELGGYTCKEFMGRYEPSMKFFSIVMTNECRYSYPPMNSAFPKRLKYMLPCAQPGERKQREAEERDLMIKYMPSPIPAWIPSAKPTKQMGN